MHAVLGAAILTGLNVRTVSEAVERLATFDVEQVAPPPPVEPPPPPPTPEDSAPEEEAAPENIRSEPTPVVAPQPRVSLPIPLPMTAAEQPGAGSDATAGASDRAGPGTGAGGQGSGSGGGGSGGTGTGAGLGSEARLLGGHQARLGSRFLRSVGLSRGSVPLRLTISPAGRVTACTPLRSSGSAQLDSELCRIMRSSSRWEPATDRSGRPVRVELTYVATFSA